MELVWTQIEKIALLNHGCITTKQAEAAGISRASLAYYVRKGSLLRTQRGVYQVYDSVSDDYRNLQLRIGNSVFSYGTALFFWGLSDRTPHTLDITVPQGSNTSRFRHSDENIRFHYVKPDWLELGRTQTVTPCGNLISLYDRERCICDLIRDRKHADMQLYTQAIKGYFSGKANIRKLLKYGKQMGIADRIRVYTEVLI